MGRFARIGPFFIAANNKKVKQKMLLNKDALIFGGILLVLLVGLLSIAWMPWVNAVALIIIFFLTYFYRHRALHNWVKLGLFCSLVPLIFLVATYRPDGFSYPSVFSLPADVGEASRYTFFINFSKATAGFVLLYLLWPRLRPSEFVAPARYSATVILAAPLLIIGLAIPVLGLEWQPKPLTQILMFAAGNLLIICVAEEAFMRLLLQQGLRNAMARITPSLWMQEAIPLLIVTLLFVAIHAGISGTAVWIYALAGFLYGLSYTLSKNILVPILIHFAVNQIHFSFLTYPLP